MLNSLRRGAFAGLVLGALSATPAPAAAQRILYSASDGFNPVTAFLDLATGVSMPISTDLTSGAIFSSDGQYVIRTVNVGTTLESRVRHVASGLEATLGVAFTPQVAHPRTLAMFGTVDGVLTRLDPSGIKSWTPCGAGVNAAFQLSADGAQLFSVCPNGHFVLIDSASGAVVRDTAIGAPGSITSFAASPDGSQVVVARLAGPGLELARLDASGAILRARPAISARLFAVSGGVRLIELTCPPTPPTNPRCLVNLVDFDSLDELHVLDVVHPFNHGVVVAEDGRQGYVSSLEPFSRDHWVVTQFDLSSGARLASAAAPFGQVAGVASLPLPPAAVVAQVTGQSVSLSWQLPARSPAATGSRLAIGSTPGSTSLGSIPLGAATTFTATGVPSGRYFVRLHTVNYTGESPASSEVVVDVP
jgi:hypothetical protein